MRNVFIPYIIDVEASGFGCESYPIEIGVALKNGQRFCSLILPETEWTHWDVEAEEIHRVSREVLSAHGQPVSDVVEQMNSMLAGKRLYSDGWVVDKPWLTILFHAAGKPMNFSVSPLELILSEKQMRIWQQTKDRVTEQTDLVRHRASNDAWIIQETFRQTLALSDAE